MSQVLRTVTVVTLLLLTLPSSTVLSFHASELNREALPAKVQEQRYDYFREVTARLNELFLELNYTCYEYLANYSGTAKVLKSYWQKDPLSDPWDTNPPRYYGPDLREDLKENWIRLGRLVSRNGKRTFEPGRLVTNGTHIGFLTEARNGDHRGEAIVHPRRFLPFERFQQQLVQNAHPRYLSYEEASASKRPQAAPPDGS